MGMGYDVRRWFCQASFVVAGDYGGFVNGGMGHQGALDLGGAQPAAIYFEEVVGAAGVPKIAVAILTVLVSGAGPLADESVFGFFVLIPVPGAGGVAAEEEIADFFRSDIVSVLVDDARLIAGD